MIQYVANPPTPAPADEAVTLPQRAARTCNDQQKRTSVQPNQSSKCSTNEQQQQQKTSKPQSHEPTVILVLQTNNRTIKVARSLSSLAGMHHNLDTRLSNIGRRGRGILESRQNKKVAYYGGTLFWGANIASSVCKKQKQKTKAKKKTFFVVFCSCILQFFLVGGVTHENIFNTKKVVFSRNTHGPS